VTAATDLLFAYGTLMSGMPLHHLIGERAEFVAAGSIGGCLVDLGGYPGALPGGAGTIRGEVYRLRSASVLAAVDAAEGPDFPRRLTAIRLDDGSEVRAWTYWFNGSVNGAVPIPNGDYRSHVTARETDR
jgi:gamma-glutamylcyclotransferase (GGCT)/AIG2-like uncharacterized protein YtfP